MCLSPLCLADALFLSYLNALTDLNERRGLVLHPVFVVAPNQEKATLGLPRGEKEKREKTNGFTEARWVMRDGGRPRDFLSPY